MITRQRTILRLVNGEGARVSKLRLVKLAFLLHQTSEAAPASATYEFLPYQFGPYSFTLNHELRSLERGGWLRIGDAEIVPARSSVSETKRIEGTFASEIDALVLKYKSVSTSSLIRRVYEQYPWFTVHAKDPSRRRARLPLAPPAVYTVGYEGMMLDGLLDLLLRSGIKRLADVRCNPVARRFGFHKSTLMRHCADVGISYVHIPTLGIPSSWRQSLDDDEAYKALFGRYETEILPANEPWVETAAKLATEVPTAFMCMEAEPRSCHRSRLAAVIADRTGLSCRELRCH